MGLELKESWKYGDFTEYPYSYKYEGNFPNAKKILFLFGNRKVTWMENLKLCCELGMKPLSFGSSSIIIVPYIDMHRIFWTGGTRLGCPGEYKWCFSNQNEWLYSGNVIDTKQNGACVALRVYYSASKYFLAYGVEVTQVQDLVFLPCDTENYFACRYTDEVKNPENLKHANQSAYNVKPINSNGCENNLCGILKKGRQVTDLNAKFVSRSIQYFGAKIHQPYKLGNWSEGCGVLFLRPKILASWREAVDYCDSLGLNLVAIASYDKQICMSKALNDDFKTRAKFWTSASDIECPGKLKWCSRKTQNFVLTDSLAWKTGNFNLANRCVYITKDNENEMALLGREDCDTKFEFLCEIKPEFNNTIDDILQECINVTDIKKRDLEKFSTVDVSTFSFKMKCFMRCVGDSLNIASGKYSILLKKVFNFIDNNLIVTTFNVSNADGGFVNSLKEKLGQNKTNLFLDYFLLEQVDSLAVKNSMFSSELKSKIELCSNTVPKTGDECTFAHSLVKCIVNGSENLDRFWEKTLKNVLVKSRVRNPDDISTLIDDFHPLQTVSNFEKATKVCTARELLASLNVSDAACKEDGTDKRIYCLDDGTNISKQALGLAALVMILPDCVFQYNGTLLTADTPARLHYLDKSARDIVAMGPDARDLWIGWDETFEDENGVTRWCSEPTVAVPVPIIGDKSQPYILVSKLGKLEPEPQLYAVTLSENKKGIAWFCKVNC
ncbi:Hypothetical predicted protein [Cloeon dipterum]|uniref:C-type lectin domain-containing protein n=1 Tax=Cloeon dipterum TaxID=197152 RepID=A0A8S1D3F7_9INSE|nr:Hypothetical predicted protein [Cloeon dipterum]